MACQWIQWLKNNSIPLDYYTWVTLRGLYGRLSVVHLRSRAQELRWVVSAC